MLEDMTPERIPQITFIRRVSSAKTHYSAFHIYRTLYVSNAYTNEIHLHTICSLRRIKKYMLNKVSDFNRIWDFVGRRNFSQEKLHFFFNDFFLFWFFFFFFFFAKVQSKSSLMHELIEN